MLLLSLMSYHATSTLKALNCPHPTTYISFFLSLASSFSLHRTKTQPLFHSPFPIKLLHAYTSTTPQRHQRQHLQQTYFSFSFYLSIYLSIYYSFNVFLRQISRSNFIRCVFFKSSYLPLIFVLFLWFFLLYPQKQSSFNIPHILILSFDLPGGFSLFAYFLLYTINKTILHRVERDWVCAWKNG